MSDELASALFGTSPTLFGASYAGRIIFVLVACLRTGFTGSSTRLGDDLAGWTSAGVDFGTRLANVGAIEARLDALFATYFLQALGYAFKAGFSAVGALEATLVALFAVFSPTDDGGEK